MPTLKANHRVIQAAKPIAGKRTRYRIDGIEGLWLDVSATGRRYWYVRYQPGGRRTRTERWYRIGDAESVGLADATQKARDVLTVAYAKERDPHAERAAKRSETLTFGDLYDDWYSRHAEPNLARADTDQSIYNTHIHGGLAKQRISSVKRADIGRLRDKVAKTGGPIASNNVLSHAGAAGMILNDLEKSGSVTCSAKARRKVQAAVGTMLGNFLTARGHR